jgi:uncharacterized sulfatase
MRCVLLLVAVVASLPASARAAQPKRYNIISICTDDQGRWALGAYGNTECRTPNMDRIAREGARFKNAFTATPVCSPSRASFMSGRYGTQVGITDWIDPREADSGVGLARDALTWAQVLQGAGYATGLIGKWHLGMQPEFHPTRRGFNTFAGFLGGGNTPMNPTLEINGKQQKLKGPLPDILTDQAIDFIKTNRERPFALCLHFRAPHLPYGPVPPEDSAPFKDLDPTVPKAPGADSKQLKKWTRDYYASIHSVDRNIGRLLKLLDELGLADNTIIVFTSDHGYMIGHHGLHTKGNGVWIAGGVNGPKRPNMFDLSLRVPLLVRWPGVVKPGTDIDAPVSNIDTFASYLGMLKVPMPPGYKQEGKDFSPLLRGEKVAWRKEVFAQYDLHNSGLAFMRSVQTEHYHLVRHHFSNYMDELYDLKEDPGETKNLYHNARYREVRDQLQASLTQWQRSINDPILAIPTSPGILQR